MIFWRRKMSKLPEKINITRTVSYYVPDLVRDIKSAVADASFEPDIEYICNYIEDWVLEDMSEAPTPEELVWKYDQE